MDNLNNLIDFISDLQNNDFDLKEVEIDLTNDEEYNSIVNSINKLKSNDLFMAMLTLFGGNNDDLDLLLKKLENRRDQIIKDKHIQELSKSNKKVIDLSEEKDDNKLVRPSQNIDVNMGLQIHKLVQEYIDTMIKPYNPKNGGLTTDQINNAYAGLYEFACWIYNHK